jgi:hypothetical protein
VQFVGELVKRWGSVVGSRCCVKLVTEVWGQFGNPEEGERAMMEAATEKRSDDGD